MNNPNPENHSHRSLVLYSAGLAAWLTATMLSAQELAFPSHYDLWKDVMTGAHKNYLPPFTAEEAAARDTDGDGKTDLVEAILFTDPMLAERPLTPQETLAQLEALTRQEAVAAAAREAGYAAARALLEPWHHDEMRTATGEEYSLEAEQEVKLDNLRQRVPVLREAAARRKAEGLALAKQLGWPETIPYGSGQAILVGVHNGLPEYHVPRNLPEAQTISTNKLWPGGSTGLSLTGLPSNPLLPRVRLGLWEVGTKTSGFSRAGTVNLSHPEFGGRVLDLDANGEYPPADQHATHVAGTLAATGSSSSAKGMAYQAQVHVRDSLNDVGELAEILTDGDPSTDLFLTNHSYGVNPGWFKDRFLGSSLKFYQSGTGSLGYYSIGTTEYPSWGGTLTSDVIGSTPFTSPDIEDYRFGYYDDDYSKEWDRTVYEAEFILPAGPGPI